MIAAEDEAKRASKFGTDKRAVLVAACCCLEMLCNASVADAGAGLCGVAASQPTPVIHRPRDHDRVFGAGFFFGDCAWLLIRFIFIQSATGLAQMCAGRQKQNDQQRGWLEERVVEQIGNILFLVTV